MGRLVTLPVAGQKAYNAREGIETPIYSNASSKVVFGQKAYNAREGIETYVVRGDVVRGTW